MDIYCPFMYKFAIICPYIDLTRNAGPAGGCPAARRLGWSLVSDPQIALRPGPGFDAPDLAIIRLIIASSKGTAASPAWWITQAGNLGTAGAVAWLAGPRRAAQAAVPVSGSSTVRREANSSLQMTQGSSGLAVTCDLSSIGWWQTY